MAIVVVIAGSYIGYQQLSDSGCTGSIKLNVAAATEIAPAVDQAANQWVAGGANVNGTCVAVSVTGINPATMASVIAKEHDVSLTGLGAPPASVAPPDVWIPDSSTWLLRIMSEAAGFVPTDGKSIAQSPVVVAMPVPVAEAAFHWPDKKLGWKDLVAVMTKSNTVRTGIVDPTRDSAGLAGLLALGQAAGTTPQGQAAKVGALRALAAGSSRLREDLLQKFPHSADANDVASSLSAAPLSEEDVIAYNAEKPPIPLAALYLDPTPPPLDYPFAVLPGVDLAKSAAATGLREALQKPAFKQTLGSAGLRSADGTVGTTFARPIGASIPSAPAAAPGINDAGGAAASGLAASDISRALGGWAAITVPGRVLAVFDISGSMSEKVPTAGGASRAKVTQGAASQGLALFDDAWAVGVWLFSTNLVGKRAWREVVPISPLTSARSKLQASVAQITPKEGGGTGLYSTALAAYKNVLSSWEPGKVNSVILFTDGQNADPNGISRASLISQLKKLNDPKRPVRLIVIGIGNEVDRNELDDIAKATPAGGVFIAPDPAKISDIFLEAIAARSGAAS
jgi:Ca-activated chloride channel family protein